MLRGLAAPLTMSQDEEALAIRAELVDTIRGETKGSRKPFIAYAFDVYIDGIAVAAVWRLTERFSTAEKKHSMLVAQKDLGDLSALRFPSKHRGFRTTMGQQMLNNQDKIKDSER